MASVEKMTEGASIAVSVEKVSAFTPASVPTGPTPGPGLGPGPGPAGILVHQDGPLSLTDVELALQETKEQREHRIRQLFAIFDTSKSGYLDHRHIEDVFRTLSIPAHNKYAKELLSVCDSDQDGKVDYDEFRKYMDNKELELYQIFQEIDVKHNGTIEPDELRQALLRAGIPIQDDQLAMFVDHVDKDNNGIITFEEWRDFLLLLPNVKTLSNIYHYWEKICLVDIGEQAVIPEGISRQLDAYKYFFAGGVAGAVSRTATAPLDRLKVLLQVQTHDQGRGVMSGLAKIYKDSGFAGFFRGNGLNVFKVAPESAIKFYAYELLKEYVVKVDGSGTKEEIGTWGRFVAGGAAGAIAQTVIYPLDVVKTRLQTFRASDGTAPPLMRLSRDIWVHEGPRAMYRGLVPSLLGMIPYAGIDLAAYETFKDLSRRFLPKDTEPGPLVQLACGTVSGALGATCVYPLQLVRTRLQAEPMNSPNRYKGMGDCFRRTFKKEGVRGFYNGLAPNLLKVAPAASITYLVYEAMKKQFSLNPNCSN